MQLHYQPRARMKLSDAISRQSNHSTDAGNMTEIKGLNISIHEVDTDMTEQKLNNICEKTLTDDTMQILIRYILKGWPKSQDKCSDNIKEFYSFHYELSVIDGLVLKDTNGIIVSEKLWENALNKLHVSHLGTSKTILRARTCVFWPGINGDIKQLCNNCEICNKFATRQQSESLENHLVCIKPWDTLACDLFEFHGKLFLIIIDRYSKFISMEPVVDHTADKTFLAFLNIFSKLGIPSKIQCDRGSTFLSRSFYEFCSNLDVFEFSSSYHHSSNPAERAVRTV